MSFCPGLIGDSVSTATFRAFLGAPPQLAVEKRLLRHMHVSVGSWFLSRRRVREGANEFLEFDGSAPDTEIMLRHCHIFFIRRQLFNEVLEKQVSVLEAGKPPREPEPEVMGCLMEMNDSLSQRLHYERKRLEHIKSDCCVNIPHQRELAPSDPLDKWDVACMMRCFENEFAQEMLLSPGIISSSSSSQNSGDNNVISSLVNSGGRDAESRAKAFLPLQSVSEAASRLAENFIKVSSSVSTTSAAVLPLEVKFDKKDEKFAQKSFIPGDYQKAGCGGPRLRPTDCTSYFRFFGERVLVPDQKVRDPQFYFRRALWGNVFRRFATNPSFLSNSVSHYWAAKSGLHPDPTMIKMPLPLADIVCRQQQLCPAHRLRTQFMYTHHDHAKQLWRSDLVMPSMRLLSATGLQTSEDMLASVIVDGFFDELEGVNNINNSSENIVSSSSKKEESSTKTDSSQKKTSTTITKLNKTDLLADERIRQVVSFVNEMSSARSGGSLDVLIQRATGSLRSFVAPPLSDEEINWSPAPVSSSESSSSETITIGGEDGDEESDEYIIVEEEGVPELDEIPNEKLEKK